MNGLMPVVGFKFLKELPHPSEKLLRVVENFKVSKYSQHTTEVRLKDLEIIPESKTLPDPRDNFLKIKFTTTHDYYTDREFDLLEV